MYNHVSPRCTPARRLERMKRERLVPSDATLSHPKVQALLFEDGNVHYPRGAVKNFWQAVGVGLRMIPQTRVAALATAH